MTPRPLAGRGRQRSLPGEGRTARRGCEGRETLTRGSLGVTTVRPLPSVRPCAATGRAAWGGPPPGHPKRVRAAAATPRRDEEGGRAGKPCPPHCQRPQAPCSRHRNTRSSSRARTCVLQAGEDAADDAVEVAARKGGRGHLGAHDALALLAVPLLSGTRGPGARVAEPQRGVAPDVRRASGATGQRVLERKSGDARAVAAAQVRGAQLGAHEFAPAAPA